MFSFFSKFKNSDKNYKLVDERKPELSDEIDRFVNMINPTILFHPVMKNNMINILRARKSSDNMYIYSDKPRITKYTCIVKIGKRNAVLNGTNKSDVEKLINYYNEYLNVFLSMLNNKEILIKGKESQFLDLLIDSARKENYSTKLTSFGNLDYKDIKEVYFRYFDTFGDEFSTTDSIDFLTEYLFINKFTSKKLDMVKAANEIAKMKKTYDFECKVKKLEQKLKNKDQDKELMTIDKLDGFNGVEFENFLAELFQKLSYSVTTTKASGDQGVDLLVKKNNEVTAIQAKRYSNSVGNGAVQEIIAGMKFYDANKGMVVTTNYFTASAKELAEKTNIILWDRDKLNEMIKLIY